jgi:hypothetical protein
VRLIVRAGALGCLMLALTVFATASSIWNEGDNGEGNAGGKPNSANITVGIGSLTDIIGKLGDVSTGADMYEIYISDPAIFSATSTGNTGNPVVDPALYLFNASGDGLFGNDNISGTDLQAQIPAGTLDALSAGLYYILIAPSGNLPEDKNGNSIFGSITGTTGVVTGSGAVIKSYGGTPNPDDSGKGYDIQLTGAEFAETPEPSTLAFTVLGIGLLAWRSRRARSGSTLGLAG